MMGERVIKRLKSSLHIRVKSPPGYVEKQSSYSYLLDFLKIVLVYEIYKK